MGLSSSSGFVIRRPHLHWLGRAALQEQETTFIRRNVCHPGHEKKDRERGIAIRQRRPRVARPLQDEGIPSFTLGIQGITIVNELPMPLRPE